MTNLKANVKDAAGYVKEQTGRVLHSRKMATEGSELRNEGRIEKGEFPKLSKVGSTQKH